jgi:hypothetical protein
VRQRKGSCASHQIDGSSIKRRGSRALENLNVLDTSILVDHRLNHDLSFRAIRSRLSRVMFQFFDTAQNHF